MIEQEFDTPSEALAHFGTKGMKWGSRKQDPGAEVKLVGILPDPIVRTTKSGNTFTVERIQPTKLQNLIANRTGKFGKKFAEKYNSGASMDIKDVKGKPIGTLFLHKKSKDEINVVWIDTEEKARGKGYATATMKAVQDIARQQGAKKVTLEVPGISPDARHIYEKLGFKVTKNPKNTRDIWGGLTEMEYAIGERR